MGQQKELLLENHHLISEKNFAIGINKTLKEENDNQRSTINIAIAEKNEIPLGDWFVSPIHPVTKGFEKWDLDGSYFIKWQ